MRTKTLVLAIIIAVLSLGLAQAYEQTLPAADEDKSDFTTKKSITELYYYDKGAANPIVKITSLKYEPYPVEPGSKFDLWLMIENIGSEKADDVQVLFVPKGPFSIQSSGSKVISELGQRQSAVLKFENIKVSDDAAEGENDITFNIVTGGSNQLKATSSLTVEVRTVEPLFGITVESNPEKIPQGGVADISVKLSNMDTSLLNDINVELSLPSQFVPVGSTVLKKIQRLTPGEEHVLDYKITALGDATAKAYSIPLRVSYSDEAGFNFSKVDTIGLLVGSEPDYYVNLEESDTFTKGTKGKVVISLSNVGPSDIKFLTLEILPSEDFTILSNSKTYIGNLEPDDYETAEFQIYAKKSGEIPLTVVAEYRDNYNEKYSKYHTVTLQSYTNRELKQYGLPVKKSQTANMIVYALAVIFLYLTYKNWRKEKNLPRAAKLSIAAMIRGGLRILSMLRWKNLKTLPRMVKDFINS
ncbi:hypothetical protein FJZ53_04005 [Candidatus Woesearchaeota archaeon]|nr:hypothetical protein [Candidatus Woesearchaeota archaeon]